MSNPYNNEIIFNGQTLMSLKEDTVTPDKVLAGETFHDRSGAPQIGTLITHDVYDGLDSTSASDALSANQGRVLKETCDDLNSKIDNKTLDSEWSVVNSTYPTYLRVKNGFVTIAMRLTGGAVPPDGQLLYVLPSDYRPTVELAVPTQNCRGHLYIKPNGNISVNVNSGQTLNAYMAAIIIYPIAL